MTDESSYRNPLGYQPVGVLMKRLAIPAVVANVVNALYNVIDQIVIGQGIGFLGNAATNIAFPLTTICLALGLMIGIGSASRFNLEMGRKEMQKAKLTIGNATILLFGVGILICLLVRIFLEPLMLIFGAFNAHFWSNRKYSFLCHDFFWNHVIWYPLSDVFNGI
ncbi:MATE family efflux transporter [Streptococcus pluranimalium]|uniref:MATE family efflux transporter n=1 Tax=Streptococcus pluranimalium TaxID=82348 RepID=UPI004046CB64